MVRLLLVLVTIAFLAEAFPQNNVNDGSSERYITLYDPEGTEHIFDLLAPLLEILVSSSDITLHLFTRANPTTSVQLPLDAHAVSSATNFDRSRRNVFVIHGWRRSYSSGVGPTLRPAFLQSMDVNLFMVDWSGPASGLYAAALACVRPVGHLLGSFINDLQNNLGLGPSQFLLAGHSLGAHVAGCAGAAANGNIGVIVGLDPAGPGFQNLLTNNRLDPSDAQFVQVIHTNSLLLGFSGNLGTADIRPNGGRIQPGCSTEPRMWCSHSRSYDYYAESLVSGGFTAWACQSYDDFTSGRCNSSATTALGGVNVDVSARGEYYLTTNSESPFSLG